MLDLARSLKPLIFLGFPLRTKMAAGRKYKGSTESFIICSEKVFSKSDIMASEPLYIISASNLAWSDH
ncbi:hypothetical protein D3C80_1974320 [compost metagenome]